MPSLNHVPQPSEPSVQRIETLDSIRGLAALAVLFGHAIGMFLWPAGWVQWTKYPLLNAAFFDGRSAVTMFFVLSGFVLARPYVSGPRAALNIPVFYIRRIIRIWLPWFCAFALSLICRLWLFHVYPTRPKDIFVFWQQPIRWQEILLQCGFLFHSLTARLVPQDWSLGVELIGSALIPLFVALARRPLHWLWLSLLALALYFVVPRDDLFSSGCYYVSFILGVLLARHHERLIAWLKQLNFYCRSGLLLVGLALYEMRRAEDHFGFNGWTADRIAWVICSVGCVFIIAATLSSRRIGAFLTIRPVVWIGRVSYSIYLLQFIVLLCIMPPLFAWLNRMGFGPSPWMLPLDVFTALVLTLALAWPFYRVAELPSIDLGHWVSAKLKNAKWLSRNGTILRENVYKSPAPGE